MKIKIVVASDNHGDLDVLKRILNDNQDADYYLHLGDSELDDYELFPFVSVKGNVDYNFDLPLDKIIDVEKHSIYICHGHAYSGDPNLISKAAKMNDCDIALFGHTHFFFDKVIDGVRVINPGSCSRAKDDYNSYVLITLDDINICVERVKI